MVTGLPLGEGLAGNAGGGAGAVDVITDVNGVLLIMVGLG